MQQKRTPEGDGKGEGRGEGGYVLDDVLDKVVQDDDNSEGTLFWTLMEAANRHISAPTIASGHFMRVASGNRAQRLEVAKKLKIPAPRNIDLSSEGKPAFIEDLRQPPTPRF
jgi:6-phosphogluconate dehydrogenase